MVTQKRLLVIHSDESTGFRILKRLQDEGNEVEFVTTGIEGVACFESYGPDLVLVDLNLVDLPAKFMVQALRQLNNQAVIVLVAAQVNPGLKFEIEAWGGNGLVSPEVNSQQLEPLLLKPEIPHFAMNEDETIQGWMDDSSSFGRGLGQQLETQTIQARQLAKMGSYTYPGHLRVIGDLENMELLDVSGDLWVEGNLHNVHVRTRGDARILGDIEDCRNLGFFCRGNLICDSVSESVVVCGRNFMWESECLNTMLNVAGRMVGMGRKSAVVGGVLKIAEHLWVGRLGDETHTPTHVEMAPRVFFRNWVDANQTMLQLSQAPGHVLNPTRKNHFDEAIKSVRLFPRFADVVVHQIFPSVTLKIGEAEEMIITQRKEPVRVMVDRSNGSSKIGTLSFLPMAERVSIQAAR
ncbi:MAG: hypothetical protein H6510_17515 [Acidobacteria bacterium]|nr:hypothetical protein [Acidobacteriota bacterium]MCB9399614.1 hypothetical protein [Acidobacteriota bacterium]